MAMTLSMTSTSPASAEHLLVAAARAGDDRAFEELYARYQQRISSFIFSKVRDHGRAEDIAQEVFISALRRLRSSDQQIAFKPWIYEIAKNACIDEFRRGTRTREVPLEADEDIPGAQRGLLSVTPTPPAAVENKQRLTDLQGAFGGLSESHHKLLVMREFEGLSYEEIGDRLGMTRQMVESGLFRARRKLTDEYAELASGRRCEQVQGAIDAGPPRSLRSLGIRERRRFSRHLAHCQPCRHTARLAGVDEALIQPRSITQKIAALLPFPLWRWIWRGGRKRGGGGGTAGAGPGTHHLAAVQSLQTAAQIAEPASSSVTLAQAAAAAAALAIAGAGGGLVGGLTGHHHAARPASAAPAAAIVGHRAPTAASAPTRSLPAATRTGRSRAAARPSGRRSGSRSAGLTGVSHVSHVARAGAGAGAGQRSSGPAGSGSPAAAATSGSPAATSAGAVSTGSLPAPVKVQPSNLTGAVKSTVSSAGRIVSAAGHALSSSPAGSSATSVAGTVRRVLPSVPAPGTTSSAAPVSVPNQPLKSTVSNLLP